MEEKILKKLQELAKAKIGKELDINANLSEQGLDSLDQLDIVVEAEKIFNVSISDDELLEIKNLTDAVQIILKKLD